MRYTTDTKNWAWYYALCIMLGGIGVLHIACAQRYKALNWTKLPIANICFMEGDIVQNVSKLLTANLSFLFDIKETSKENLAW